MSKFWEVEQSSDSDDSDLTNDSIKMKCVAENDSESDDDEKENKGSDDDDDFKGDSFIAKTPTPPPPRHRYDFTRYSLTPLPEICAVDCPTLCPVLHLVVVWDFGTKVGIVWTEPMRAYAVFDPNPCDFDTIVPHICSNEPVGTIRMVDLPPQTTWPFGVGKVHNTSEVATNAWIRFYIHSDDMLVLDDRIDDSVCTMLHSWMRAGSPIPSDIHTPTAHRCISIVLAFYYSLLANGSSPCKVVGYQ